MEKYVLNKNLLKEISQEADFEIPTNFVEIKKLKREKLIKIIEAAASPSNINCSIWSKKEILESVEFLFNDAKRQNLKTKMKKVDEYHQLFENKYNYMEDRGYAISNVNCSCGCTFYFYNIDNLINVMLILGYK